MRKIFGAMLLCILLTRAAGAEGDLYDIRYIEESVDGLKSRYQVILSLYTGEIIDWYDLDSLRQE